MMSDGPRYEDDFYAWTQYRAEPPRVGSMETIDDARETLADKLTATLRRDAEANFDKLYAEGRRRAARGLQRHGEPEVAEQLPPGCPWSLDEICREDWYPARPGAPGDQEVDRPA
jgi:hypothetical protein